MKTVKTLVAIFIGRLHLLVAQKDGVIGSNEIIISVTVTPTEAQYSCLGSKFLARKLKASRGMAMIYSS